MADRPQYSLPTMETQTAFDLNQALAAWRQELAAQPGVAPADAQELEAHLRESCASLQKSGLSEVEAFLIARRRVGQPAQIAEEFIKAEPSRYWRLCLICAFAGAIIMNLWQMTLTVWAEVISTFFEETFSIDISSSWYGLLLFFLYLLIIIVPLFVLARWLMRRRRVAQALRSPGWLLAVVGVVMIVLVERLQLWGIHLLNPHSDENIQTLDTIFVALNGNNVGPSSLSLKNVSEGIFAAMDVGSRGAEARQFGNNVLWCFCLFVLLIWLWPKRKRNQMSIAR
jgi:hypothetical protein